MTHELIERYIYAATKRMSGRMRDDVSRELRSLIDDMLTERCGGAAPSEKDIVIVLTELGSPSELAEKYDADGKRSLIGPPYFTTYKYVLGLVLACLVFGITISCIISQIVTPPERWYTEALEWFGMLSSGAVFAFTFVTLLFAFFYHRNIKLGHGFDLYDLPAVPEKGQRISKGEAVFEIVLSAVFIVIMLAAPQIFCIIFTKAGDGAQTIPVFNTDVIRRTWYIICLMGAAGIVSGAVALLEGRHSRRMMAVSLVTNLVSALLTVWWFLGFELINPDFMTALAEVFTGDDGFLIKLFENTKYIVCGCVLVALGIDTVTEVVRGMRDN